MRQLVHSDFNAAFSKGHVFHSSHGDIAVRQEDIASLVAPSGKIIACDPGCACFAEDRIPFERSVAPGRHSISLCWAKLKHSNWEEERIACARLRLKPEKPVHWELATRPGEDAAQLKGGSFFGYGVDSGMGCFVDVAAFADMEDEDISAALQALPAGEWGQRIVNPSHGVNLVAFHSGWGDGSYPSYWGLDGNGEVIALVTDFGFFVENVEAEVVVERILEKLGQQVVDPDLTEAGYTVRLLQERAQERDLWLEMTGDSCEATLVNGDEKLDSLHSAKSWSQGVWTLGFRCSENLRPDARLILRYTKGIRPL
jgi:hypothetical protein